MEKLFTKPVTLGLSVVLLLAAVFASQFIEHQKVEAAATNVVGLQMIDWSDCSYSGLGTARYASDVATWMPWTGDSDNYDPDCVRLYLGNTVPKDLDIRIGIQARDINTPCGFLWLFKCGDGGGTIVYGPWASESPNSWTAWAGDADMFDADQWRLIVDTRSRYGFTVSDFKLGIQVGDVGDIWSGGGGCTQQIGTTRYTASSSVSTGWTSWAADNYDNGDYNCTRINLVSTSTLNDPVAALTGTSTVYYGNSINIPWTVDYINTTTGCTLTGRNGGGTITDPATTITSNGSGSKTSIAITVPTTYTLTCTGNKSGTIATAAKTITPFSAPATLSFSMSPTSGLAAGGISTSTITATNSSSCTLVGKNLSGAVIDSGFTYTPPPPSAAGPAGSQVGPIYLTSGTTWTVPANWGNTNTIYIIGGGGGGGTGGTRYGGGGGGYTRVSNVSLPAGQTVGISVGGGGTPGYSGGNSYICNSTSNCASIGGSAVVGGARGGLGGYYGGTGGQAGSGVVSGAGSNVRYSGGTGANNGYRGGGGGGGAAGPGGNGGNGGSQLDEGGGGGGHGGGTVGGTPECCTWGQHYGSKGGANYQGVGRGTRGNGRTWGGAGSYGGGGGGGDDSGGGAGGNGLELNGSVGGGGGGGGSGYNGGGGGSGGYYGGGGGSGGSNGYSGGYGRQGIIVIYYNPSTVAANTDARVTAHTVNQTTDYTVDCTGLDGVHVVRTVRVTLSSCLLDGVTINNGGSSNFYSQSIAPAGHTCSEYGPSVRGCTNGALTGNTSYVYASCLDQSSITIKANDISTATSVRKGSTVALSWDGGNATSCTVTGTDGFSSDEITATRSVTINQKTIYTAVCTLGASSKRASVTVNILPTIIEN